jgi:hypothetical protein
MNAATRNAELAAATEQGFDAQVDEASEEIRYSTGECVLGTVLVAKAIEVSAPSCWATTPTSWPAICSIDSRRPSWAMEALSSSSSFRS